MPRLPSSGYVEGRPGMVFTDQIRRYVGPSLFDDDERLARARRLRAMTPIQVEVEWQGIRSRLLRAAEEDERAGVPSRAAVYRRMAD